MKLDQGNKNANDNLDDVNEENENPNGLDLEHNVDGNDLEEAQTNREVTNEYKQLNKEGEETNKKKKLKKGKKLEVNFYNNRVVGSNNEMFARHLGIIVRETIIFLVRVYKWKALGIEKKITCGQLYKVTEKKITLKSAFVRNLPNGLDEKEWKWFIMVVYSSEEFKKVSASNSTNILHYPKELAHRMGSKPFRQGGNKGKKPKLVDIFHLTRKNGTSLLNVETAKKIYAL
ncbi:Chorismate synthase [Bienertia sinuspersici]